MIIKKSIKLSLKLLIIGVLIFLFIYQYSEFFNLSATQYGRNAQFGAYLALIISVIKFIFDFYLIYIKHAHVEITDEVILDKTMPLNEKFYAWSEIVNVIVLNGFFCEGLRITFKKDIISGGSINSTYDSVDIKELKISSREKSTIGIICRKHVQIGSTKNNTRIIK